MARSNDGAVVGVCRLGIAEEAREGVSDEDRVLTEVGAEKFKRMAKRVARLADGKACVVFSSPCVKRIRRPRY